MVKGLDVFRAWFADYPDQYILIGGTAASLAMEEAGLEFRATKDLDIVLHVEALRPAFGETFWKFIEAGGYEIRQASDAGKPSFYRFQWDEAVFAHPGQTIDRASPGHDEGVVGVVKQDG